MPNGTTEHAVRSSEHTVTSREITGRCKYVADTGMREAAIVLSGSAMGGMSLRCGRTRSGAWRGQMRVGAAMVAPKWPVPTRSRLCVDPYRSGVP